MKEAGIVEKRYVLNRKKVMIGVVLLLFTVISVTIGVLHAKVSAANVTYAKYNGVDYASVILNDNTIDNNRYYALLKAQQMVTVEWTAPVTFSSWLDNNGIYSTTKATDGTTSTGSFIAGKTYVGIPYSMADHSADDVKWMNKITSGVSSSSLNTHYYSYNKTTTAYGADCSYFVYQALKAANTGYSFGYRTTSAIASSGYYTKIAKCSDYTTSTLNALFAQLKPGDIALKSGHVMLYVGRNGNNFAFFEAAYPVTRYVTYNLSHMINSGYTFYKFNGFKDTASTSSNTTNSYGYVAGTYQVYTKTGETLNIRGGQGVEFDILGEIPDLTKVIVTEVKDYWGKVTYNGITGWISLIYCNYIGSASCDVLSCIDYPANNFLVTGTYVYLQGWTLDKHGIAKVTYSLNGGEEIVLTLGSRSDVAAVYPAYSSANNSWTAKIDASKLRNGANTITIYAYCSAGVKTTVGSRTVTYSNGTTNSGNTTTGDITSSTIISALTCKTKECIDYPKNDTDVTGSSVYVQGWTVDAHGIVKATYSVNGGSEVTMNLGSRSDVAAAYSSYPSSNNSWTANISTSELSTGANTITFYAYCGDNKKITVGTRKVTVSKTTDTDAPVISNIKISDKSETGYTVTCTVTDASALSHVYFPTWTTNNGQDDIVWGKGTIAGNTVTYRVNTSAHNGETKNYVTHIYAHDQYGNVGFAAVGETINLK